MTINQNKLWEKVLTMKYCQRQPFLGTRIKNADSYTSKGICGIKNIIQKRMCFLIGNGNTVSVLKHSWISGLDNMLNHVKLGIRDLFLDLVGIET